MQTFISIHTQVFQAFLRCDIRLCGQGCLPNNSSQIKDEILPGPFILQVSVMMISGSFMMYPYILILSNAFEQIEAIKNIGQAEENRKQDNASRCLLMAVTDGVQQILALEYRRVQDLMITSPLGTKVGR